MTELVEPDVGLADYTAVGARWRLAGRFGTMLLLLVMGGCDALGLTKVCDLGAHPGIRVWIGDSVTFQHITADSLVVYAESGHRADTTRAVPYRGTVGAGIGIAHEMTGLWDIRVVAAGYEAYEQEGIRVEKLDDCHVRTADLFAWLVKLDPGT